jgi:transposase
MTRAYPKELRWRIVHKLREGRSTKEIAQVLHVLVGLTFVKKIKYLFDTNQNNEYRPRPGKLRRLSGEL